VKVLCSSRFRAKTPQEIVLEGLRGKSKLLNMEIKTIPEKGRGVFVNESVSAGSFVVEYKTARVYSCSRVLTLEVAYAYDRTAEILPPGEALCSRLTLWLE